MAPRPAQRPTRKAPRLRSCMRRTAFARYTCTFSSHNPLPASQVGGKRRVGVSAETASETDGMDYTPTVIPKSDAVRSRIAAATEKNTLFAGLAAEQHTAVTNTDRVGG